MGDYINVLMLQYNSLYVKRLLDYMKVTPQSPYKGSCVHISASCSDPVIHYKPSLGMFSLMWANNIRNYTSKLVSFLQREDNFKWITVKEAVSQFYSYFYSIVFEEEFFNKALKFSCSTQPKSDGRRIMRERAGSGRWKLIDSHNH